MTSIEPREGGMIEWTADGPPVREELRCGRGRILVWDPPHTLEHEWGLADVEHGVVRYELTQHEKEPC